MMAMKSDYQDFDLSPAGRPCNIGKRMAQKMEAIPLPDFEGKSVLDVGCDFAFWSFLAADRGAARVVGVDRNRPVRGIGNADIIAHNRAIVKSAPNLSACSFEHSNLGKEWLDFGRFDVILMLSLYHHIFENCGDHDAIWYWLWTQCAEGGEVLWENPVDVSDSVSFHNISADKHHLYTKEAILKAAGQYFEAEYIGPAIHETTREVYRFRPKAAQDEDFNGRIEDGAGGATKAFLHAGSQRIRDFYAILGILPFPGSLNVRLAAPFDWGTGYFRAQILDVLDRSKGFDGPWGHRWARVYPLLLNREIKAYAFRFEGDQYPLGFLELIAPEKLREVVGDDMLTITKRGPK